jgi:TorA maturation chaperone TorD
MDEAAIIAAGERESVYRFFADLCLNPPSDSLVDMVRDGSILSVFQGYDDGAAGFPWLSEFVKEAEGIPNLKDELEAEHTAMFVLPSGVLPHESAYLDKEKRVGGRFTESVRRFYENAGAPILDACIQMPDHIGVELEFMAFLCRMEKELRERAEYHFLHKCIDFQKSFMEGHLSRWAYRCFDEISNQTECRFYKALMYFMGKYLKSEEEYLATIHVTGGEGETTCVSVA